LWGRLICSTVGASNRVSRRFEPRKRQAMLFNVGLLKEFIGGKISGTKLRERWIDTPAG
jgi:hypothetical protein